MTKRIDAIAEELMHHRMRSGSICSCGHKYRLGESIMVHRAEAADVAITLHETGVPLDDLHKTVAMALRFGVREIGAQGYEKD